MARSLAAARALVDLGRWQDALATLDAAAPQPGDEGEHLCLRARCLLALDRAGEALNAADRARMHSPEFEWPHRLAAIASLQLGRRRAALAAAAEAARLEPELVPVLHTLARAQLENGDERGADETSLAALRVGPDTPLAWETRGVVALRTARPQLAESSFRRALQLAPVDPDVHAQLADAVEAVGRLDEARELRLMAARGDPHDADKRRSLLGSAGPVVGAGLVLKLLLARGIVVAIRDPFVVSRVAMLAVLGVLFAIGWGWHAVNRRRAARHLPATVWVGLRPERRNSALSWFAAFCIVVLTIAVIDTVRWAWGLEPARQPLLEAVLAVIGLTSAWRCRAGAARRLRVADVASMTGRVLRGLVPRRPGSRRRLAPEAFGWQPAGEPLLFQRWALGFSEAFVPWVLVGPVAVTSAPAALIAAGIALAAEGWLIDGRHLRLTQAGYARMVVDRTTLVPLGGPRRVARAAARFLLAPVLVIEFACFARRPHRCVHDRLTGALVVRLVAGPADDELRLGMHVTSTGGVAVGGDILPGRRRG